MFRLSVILSMAVRVKKGPPRKAGEEMRRVLQPDYWPSGKARYAGYTDSRTVMTRGVTMGWRGFANDDRMEALTQPSYAKGKP